MVFFTGLLLAGYEWLYRHARVVTFGPSSPWPWVIAFVWVDFAYYWLHRYSHQIRWMWALHSVHHSARQITLSVAYRLGWTSLVSGPWLFLIPVCWLGFDPRGANSAAFDCEGVATRERRLVDAGVLTRDQLQRALAEQASWGGRLGQVLLNLVRAITGNANLALMAAGSTVKFWVAYFFMSIPPNNVGDTFSFSFGNASLVATGASSSLPARPMRREKKSAAIARVSAT